VVDTPTNHTKRIPPIVQIMISFLTDFLTSNSYCHLTLLVGWVIKVWEQV